MMISLSSFAGNKASTNLEAIQVGYCIFRALEVSNCDSSSPKRGYHTNASRTQPNKGISNMEFSSHSEYRGHEQVFCQ